MSVKIDTYVSLDLETTGLDPKKDKIIEIGAVRVTKGIISKTYSTLVNPARILEPRITELTGITNEELAEAPYLEDIIDSYMEFLGDDILLGHSVLFDYSFTKRAAVNNRYRYERKAIDTLKIARKYLPELPSRALGALCDYYSIEHKAHRALEDATATHRLYQCLYRDFYCDEAEREKDFLPVSLKYQVKKEGPITPPQRERLMRMVAERHIILPYKIDRMTKNEASRVIDLILNGSIV